MTKRVLVTGATGFVGGVLCGVLHEAGYVVRAALRRTGSVPSHADESVTVGEIDSRTEWREALHDVDSVIHAAARVHVMDDDGRAADLYMETNWRGTRRLAQAAATAGVRRVVHLSSVKVNGEESGGKPYSADDDPHPKDPYAHSKLLAERSLLDVAADSGMQAVNIRSPLVYGPGVRANFLRLLTWVDKRRPLPLGAVTNRRSLVSVWNLCDLLRHALQHPTAAGRTWMVSDGEDLSTPELIKRIAQVMQRPAHLLPVPMGMLYFVGRMLGRQADIARLCGSLTVDITRTRQELGWSAPMLVDDALARTVSWYLHRTPA